MRESSEGQAQHHGDCANCGATLGGRFCQQCGQAAHVHRSLLHLVEELLHGIFHFETKAWRTLGMLAWRPGRMIREYIDGRRARYVAPLPLFLFMMFALFLTFSLTTNLDGADKAEAATPPAAAASTPDVELNDLRWLPAVIKGTRSLGADELHEELQKNLPWAARPSIEHKILHAANNRELAVYKVKNGAAKYAILLVPLTLPLLWLLFIRRRDVQMFDHVVFSFYSLSAMALLLIGLSLLDAVGLPMLGETLKLLLPPLMFYTQLKGTYQLARWGAIWRTAVLLLYALLAMGAYLLVVIFASM
ncbi:DUF3667 domain-containing protein [Pelomonas sp. KK5]|uniref:DUF3667 domain-containing protein n=1 Tax=Pelomonas sp. KK5 TaxID=1855730 RepID=UPI00097C52C6|nr:DUF3667 domain-containing protein [Pelomonas sp. KK5]